MKILHLDVKGAKIPVVFESSKQLPVAAVKLVFKVAGACRDGETAGLAAMAANILNEGTLSLGSAEFARLLEMRAINLGADAGFETLTISLNCLKEHFAYACEMLGALLREPNLTNEALERCKAVTLGEIAASEDDFDHVARCGLMEILYPKTPLAYANFGTEKSVENMKLEQVKDFIKTHLNLANLFISMGGDVSEKECELAAKAVEILPVGAVRELPKFSPSAKRETKEIIKKSEQAYIYFGAPFEADEGERFKARVATYILGEGGFGSRLMEEIRVKRGLAYSAYARNIFAMSYKQIFGYMQTKNDKKDEAIAVIQDEFAKFTKSGVKADELAQAKKFLLGSLSLRQETLFARLDIAQNEFYEGKKLGDFVRELDKISALKLGDLNDFIARRAEINDLSFCIVRNEI